MGPKLSLFEEPPPGNSQIYYRPVESGGMSDGTKFRRYAALHRDSNEPVMVSDWIDFLINSNNQQQDDSLASTIAKCPYKAVYFETKAVTKQSMGRTPFEFVLVDANYLYQFAESRPDESAFAEYFKSCGEKTACAFANLGRDAILVAPVPQPGQSSKSYSHLAAFVREGSPNEVSSTMSLVAETYRDVLSKRDEDLPLWLSTCGTGVAWLHFRLDDRPKYYQYSKFKKF